jgi:putative glycosyltransferase (TIGR04372 family)
MLMQIESFWARQYSQIRKDGWAVLRRKSVRLLQVGIGGLLYIPAIPLVLVIRIIRPLIWIRIGHIRSDVIGHSVFDPEYYLAEREVENSATFDCFYFLSKNPPNEQWSLMVRNHLKICPLFRYLDKINRLIPGGEAHHKVAGVTGSRDLKGYLSLTKPHFSFTICEDNKGHRFLDTLGAKSKEKFVCLIVRDSAYKDGFQKRLNDDWSYHNHRDSDIDTYEEAAMFLAIKGYWVFRMGKMVHKPFKADHPRILDYANSSYRSEFLDIWLMANCFFCITTGTGIDEVADIFRRPLLYVNYVLFTHMVLWSEAITVPKKLYSIKEERFLTLTEQLKHSYSKAEEYENLKILVKNLSAEDILDAVLEMEGRLTGNWKESEEDLQLQDRFWKIFTTWPDFNKYHGRIHPKARVGNSFLKENILWLS